MNQHTPRLTQYQIPAPIPKPIRILFASDLHNGEETPFLSVLRQANPDLILIGGDFLHHSDQISHGFAFLRGAAAVAPTYCSVGNHEGCYDGNLKQAVKETGAVLLDNEAICFGPLAIGGLSSGFQKTEKQSNFQKTPLPSESFLDDFEAMHGYRILMSHHPEYYPTELRQRDIPLILSGHAHGGQWRLFGQGLFAPGQGWFPRYTGGLYEGRLLVSRGAYNSTPVPRLFNPTEMVLITLLPREEKRRGRDA